jgi:hypothetical protein
MKMEEKPYISKKLIVDKVYRKKRGLLTISIHICIQLCLHNTTFIHVRKCIKPVRNYNEVIVRNESGYFLCVIKM